MSKLDAPVHLLGCRIAHSGFIHWRRRLDSATFFAAFGRGVGQTVYSVVADVCFGVKCHDLCVQWFRHAPQREGAQVLAASLVCRADGLMCRWSTGGAWLAGGCSGGRWVTHADGLLRQAHGPELSLVCNQPTSCDGGGTPRARRADSVSAELGVRVQVSAVSWFVRTCLFVGEGSGALPLTSGRRSATCCSSRRTRPFSASASTPAARCSPSPSPRLGISASSHEAGCRASSTTCSTTRPPPLRGVWCAAGCWRPVMPRPWRRCGSS